MDGVSPLLLQSFGYPPPSPSPSPAFPPWIYFSLQFVAPPQQQFGTLAQLFLASFSSCTCFLRFIQPPRPQICSSLSSPEAGAKPAETGCEWRSYMGHGIRQRRPYESYEFDDISGESVHRRKRRACTVSASSRESGSEELGIVANYCGRETSYNRMFGVFFPNRSFPMDASSFAQIDSTHWVLDMNTFVGEAYDQVKEMCIFLLNEFSLPPEKALAVYVQSPGSEFQYCGAVHRGCPSAVLSLLWPSPGGQMQLMAPDAAPLSAKIGLAIEDLISLPAINVGQQQRVEALAMKVGENLFNFMQSFCSVDGNKLVVPMDILNMWFKKFQEKARRDPEYIKSFMG